MAMVTDAEGGLLEEGEGGTLLGLPDLDNEIDVSWVVGCWGNYTIVNPQNFIHDISVF